jgi:hypothetical protein
VCVFGKVFLSTDDEAIIAEVESGEHDANWPFTYYYYQ